MNGENMTKYNVEKIDDSFEREYREYMIGLCGNDNVNLPGSYLHNFRPWECGMAYKHANFGEKDIVIDTGSMNTFFGIFLARDVEKVYVTDNFYWATREFMIGLEKPEDWAKYVEKYGNKNKDSKDSKDWKVKVENADLMKLDYKDEYFDKVISISTIEHVIDDYKALIEMVRVLKRGELLLITSEFNEDNRYGKEYSETDGSYYRVYTPETFDRLLLSIEGSVAVEKTCIAFPCSKPRQLTQVFACIRKL